MYVLYLIRAQEMFHIEGKQSVFLAIALLKVCRSVLVQHFGPDSNISSANG